MAKQNAQMPKRLLVTLKDAEYREIKGVACLRHLSTKEWVRQAVEWALRRQSSAEIARKLEVIRAAAQHSYPVPTEN
jgi:hypothetical protein